MSAKTYQVRVFSDVRDYLSFGSTTSSSSIRDTAAVEIGANNPAEYFTTTSGQVLAWLIEHVQRQRPNN